MAGSPEEAGCSECGFSCPSEDGIHFLSQPASRYEPWLNLPPVPELRSALSRGASFVFDHYAKNARAKTFVRQNSYNVARGSWQVLCPLRRDSVVADFGCGLGAISRSLARNCGVVLGVDACLERLMINETLNRELGFSNIQLFCGTHADVHRFLDHSLDGIVLNGVLEWLPENATGPVAKIHLDFLRECRRALKPDGWLYLGIENRWGFKYFLGAPDEHVNLRFTTVMPRWAAELYSRRARKKPYRTYTYGHSGYRQLLAEAGFRSASFFAPIPDYRQIQMMIPLDPPGPAPDVARHLGIEKPWKRRLVESRRFLRTFSPSFGIVASSGKSPLPAWWPEAGAPGAGVESIRSKYDEASIRYRTPGGILRVRQIALSKGAESKLRMQTDLAAEIQRRQARLEIFSDWRLEEKGGYVWVDRKMIDGTPLSDLPPELQARHFEAVFEELRRIHAMGPLLSGPLLSLPDVLDDFTAGVMPRSFSQAIREIAAAHSARSSKPLLMHGDCTARNVVISEGRAELIDWEWSRVVDFPGFDILNFLWRDRLSPDDSGCLWTRSMIEERLADSEASRSFRLLHPDEDWKDAVISFWVVRMARGFSMMRERGGASLWIDEVMRPSIAAMREALELR